jgi:hypothetical protein
VFALVLSHVFISYFVSLPSVLDMVQRNPAEHPTAFTWVVVMSDRHRHPQRPANGVRGLR